MSSYRWPFPAKAGPPSLEFRFDAEQWRSMTTAERSRRCRAMAEQALAEAMQADATRKEVYLDLSQDWLTLAAEIERESE